MKLKNWKFILEVTEKKVKNYDILENDEEIHISTKELEPKNGLTFYAKFENR